MSRYQFKCKHCSEVNPGVLATIQENRCDKVRITPVAKPHPHYPLMSVSIVSDVCSDSLYKFNCEKCNMYHDEIDKLFEVVDTQPDPQLVVQEEMRPMFRDNP